MATSNTNEIVVWERSNKLGKWCPYTSEICLFLEENRTKGMLTVCLGEVDKALKVYTVHFKDMMQISEATGTKSPVRRQLYDSVCVLGRGFSWQWLDDHDAWNTYDIEVNNYIDIAFLEGRKSVSLKKKFPGYRYEIFFSNMSQINKLTKRKRKVRRIENTSPYPISPCSTHTENGDEVTKQNGMKDALTPEFLSKEVPGTETLLYQVNAYKRNVEGPDGDTVLMQAGASPKHLKYFPEEKQDNKSVLEIGIPMF